jgi:hypothetical protein
MICEDRKRCTAFGLAIRSVSGEHGMLRRYGRETRYANFECVGHYRELCMVREVGLEEVLGLGNAADVWVRGVRRMRDFSLPGRAGKPGQGSKYFHVWA